MNAATRKQYFTLDEANRRLPLVRAIVEDIVALYGDINERRERLAAVRSRSSQRDESDLYSEELEQMEADLEKDIEKFRGFVEELQELGAELKDAVTGLIDFPAQIDGRDVYLCWRLGEEEIGFWHELDGGFAGRQSLLENSLFDDQPSSVDDAGDSTGIDG